MRVVAKVFAASWIVSSSQSTDTRRAVLGCIVIGVRIVPAPCVTHGHRTYNDLHLDSVFVPHVRAFSLVSSECSPDVSCVCLSSQSSNSCVGHGHGAARGTKLARTSTRMGGVGAACSFSGGRQCMSSRGHVRWLIWGRGVQ